MRKHTPASCLIILLLFLAQPAFPQDKPAAESAHPKEIEIVLLPGTIKSIRVTGFPWRSERDRAFTREQLLERLKPYSVGLPYPERFSEDQLKELLKDQAKWRSVYLEQMRELLKEQFYSWEELYEARETLRELQKGFVDHRMSYDVMIDLKTPSQGIQSLEYVVNTYIDARAIIEDLQHGAIKSVLVESEGRDLRDEDIGKWVVCKNYCGIKAFIY